MWLTPPKPIATKYLILINTLPRLLLKKLLFWQTNVRRSKLTAISMTVPQINRPESWNSTEQLNLKTFHLNKTYKCSLRRNAVTIQKVSLSTRVVKSQTQFTNPKISLLSSRCNQVFYRTRILSLLQQLKTMNTQLTNRLKKLKSKTRAI
jgi:hypothetical protein